MLQADGSFYRSIPRGDDAKMKQEALAIARKADVIVCAMGELQEMSGECASRSDLELFDVQRELLEELLKLDKPLELPAGSDRVHLLQAAVAASHSRRQYQQ